MYVNTIFACKTQYLTKKIINYKTDQVINKSHGGERKKTFQKCIL